jgi:TonB-dependent receptor
VRALVSANALVLAALPALAQEASDAPVVVTVTGFKKSYSDALAMKRQAVGVSDSISSDGDRFPDLNVGEALQRIPGIQVNREEDSRNASINLRGLPGNYAKTTVNGMDFASPVLGGAPPMGAFESDIFSAFTVVKSVSAADQSGGISGNIDMQIAPALSRKEGASLKLGAEYDTLGGYKTPKSTFSVSKKYLDGKLGVFGVVGWRKEKFRRDSLFVNQFTTLNTRTPDFLSRYKDYYAADCTGQPSPCVATPGGTGAISTAGITAPTDLRQAVKFNEGNLASGAFGAEMKVTPHFRVGGTYLFSRRNMQGTGTDILDIDFRDSNTILDPTSAPFKHTDGRYYVTDYKFTNPRVFGSYRAEPFKQAVDGLNLKATFQNDDWRVDATGVLSKATNYAYQGQLDVRNNAKPITATNPVGNGITGQLGVGSGISNYVLGFNQSTPALGSAQTTGPWTWGGPGNAPVVNNTNGDTFIVAGSDNYEDNKVNGLRLDFERFLDVAWLESIQFGGQYNKNTVHSHAYRSSAAGLDYTKIGSSFVRTSDYAGDFFGGNAGNYLQNWQTVDYGAAAAALQPTISSSAMRTASGWVNDPADGGFTSNNFSKDDKIKALYLMAKLDGNVGRVRVRGHVGLRHEDTDQVITSMDRNGTGATATFMMNTKEKKYSNNLPSLLLAADLTDKLVLRYGAYKTFVRPNPRDISPISTTVVQDAINGAYTVSLGRVGIEPYHAFSQDLSLEYYNRPNSLIGLAIYRKQIAGMIVGETRDALLCPADGYNLGLGHWSIVGDRCVSDLPATGSKALNGMYTIDVNGAVNSPNDLIAEGAELTVQQTFDFLPAPFNGMGGVFNYSYTRTKGQAPDGSKAYLNNVSPRSANFILYYETPVWGVRGVYNYRDDYNLPGGGTFSGAARSVKARGQLDLSASYKLTSQLSISADAFNLTDSYRTEYEGSMAKLRRADYDGRTYQVALNYTFF